MTVTKACSLNKHKELSQQRSELWNRITPKTSQRSLFLWELKDNDTSLAEFGDHHVATAISTASGLEPWVPPDWQVSSRGNRGGESLSSTRDHNCLTPPCWWNADIAANANACTAGAQTVRRSRGVAASWRPRGLLQQQQETWHFESVAPTSKMHFRDVTLMGLCFGRRALAGVGNLHFFSRPVAGVNAPATDYSSKSVIVLLFKVFCLSVNYFKTNFFYFFKYSMDFVAASHRDPFKSFVCHLDNDYKTISIQVKTNPFYISSLIDLSQGLLLSLWKQACDVICGSKVNLEV